MELVSGMGQVYQVWWSWSASCTGQVYQVWSWSAAWVKCTRCGGVGQLAAWVKCTRCGGVGQLAAWVKCTRCEVGQLAAWIECTRCGTGQLAARVKCTRLWKFYVHIIFISVNASLFSAGLNLCMHYILLAFMYMYIRMACLS